VNDQGPSGSTPAGSVGSGAVTSPAGSFNALFTHRVRVASADDIDQELTGWLRAAYTSAG
jgi:hypothetical protein